MTAAGPGHSRLLGAEVKTIGGCTVEEAVAALAPLIARDNDQQVRLQIPVLLRQTAILHGLGLTGDLGQVALTVRFPDGTSGEATADAVPGRFRWDRHPPGWTRLDRHGGRTALGGLRVTAPAPAPPRAALLVRVPGRRRPGSTSSTTRSPTIRPSRSPPSATGCSPSSPTAVLAVIDLRWNGGGNTFLSQALLHHLIRNPEISRRGALFVIIGRLDLLGRAEHRDRHRPRDRADLRRGAHRLPAQLHRRDHPVRASLQQAPRQRRRPVLADLLARGPPDLDRARHLRPAPTFEAFRRNDDPALDAILALREHLPGR